MEIRAFCVKNVWSGIEHIGQFRVVSAQDSDIIGIASGLRVYINSFSPGLLVIISPESFD